MRYFHPQVGISAFHIIFPNESFNDNNHRLGLRYILHGEVMIPIQSFYFTPRVFQMQQRKATDLITGMEFGFNIQNQTLMFKKFFAGIFFRNDFSTAFDASILMIGTQIKHWQLGFSYDINTSELANATQKRGAFEVSVIYTSKSTIPKKITIPCDRI